MLRNRHFQQEMLLVGVASVSGATVFVLYIFGFIGVAFLVSVTEGLAATTPLLGTVIFLLGATAVISSIILAIRWMWRDVPANPPALRRAAYFGFVIGIVLLIALIVWSSTHPTPCVTPPSGLPPELPPCPPGATS